MRISVDSDDIPEKCNSLDEYRARVPSSIYRLEEKFLTIRMEYQEKSNWCWAAIASSLANFYKFECVSQLQVAERVIGPTSGDSANTVALLGEALRCVGCRGEWSPGRPSLRMIAKEIGEERPVGVCLQWPTGGSHYLVITGCAEATREIALWDPLHGPSMHSYDAFPRAYHSAGAVWRGAYLTGPFSGSPRESE